MKNVVENKVLKKLSKKFGKKEEVKSNEKFINLLKRIYIDLKINNSDEIIKEYLKNINQEKLMR